MGTSNLTHVLSRLVQCRAAAVVMRVEARDGINGADHPRHAAEADGRRNGQVQRHDRLRDGGQHPRQNH